MYSYIYIFILLFFSVPAAAQIWVEGKVFELGQDQKETPLTGANVRWMDFSLGTLTDVDGYFKLERPEGADSLIVSHTSFGQDTLLATTDPMHIILGGGINLGQVDIITGQSDASTLMGQ